MTISFPLSMPTVKSFSSIHIIADNAIARAESPFTYSEQIYSYSGERWRLEVRYPMLSRRDYGVVKAFLLSLRQGVGTFRCGDPGCKTPIGPATGTPLVKGGGQIGEDINTDGWTPSTNGILKAGDDIQIGDWLYTVLADVNSDGGGNATIDIWPALKVASTDNAVVVVFGPTSLFRLTSSPVSFAAGADKNYEVGFEAVEASV